MTNRTEQVCSLIDATVNAIADPSEHRAAYIHLYGVAQCMVLLAGRRGLDPELSRIIGLLHDIYSYRTGNSEQHAVHGAEIVREMFANELAGLFTEEEQGIIVDAIAHHSEKNAVHGPYEELLKDADVIQRYLYDETTEGLCRTRVESTAAELGIR